MSRTDDARLPFDDQPKRGDGVDRHLHSDPLPALPCAASDGAAGRWPGGGVSSARFDLTNRPRHGFLGTDEQNTHLGTWRISSRPSKTVAKSLPLALRMA